VTDRTNDDWLEQLGLDGARGEAAIAELRAVLRRGLGKALRGHPGVDDAFLEDMTQDAMLKVLNGRSSFRGTSKFTTWAVAIAVRVAFSELRRARWKDVSLDRLAEDGQAPAPVAAAPASASSTERDELIAVLRRVIDTDLTERQRFLLLAELNGVPQAELCERLGLNRNALYKLGHDARHKLRRGVMAAGITEDDVRQVFAIAS
jgi:RNA polymerase sigma-70 factor (ECF subfamily)